MSIATNATETEPNDQTHCTLGAGAIILADNHIPLVKVGYGPAKGQWILPGGYLQKGEHPAAAAERETREETGLLVTVTGQVSVRHRIRKDGSSDVYWVFLGELVRKSGPLPILTWPRGEIEEARFWRVEDILRARDVRPYTRLMVQRALSESNSPHRLLQFVAQNENDDQAFGMS